MATLVSVVIPAYNSQRWIASAIESVLAQTWRDRELIVVDDGSTDETGSIARAFGDHVTVVRIENGGPAKARNAGIARARGEFVAFLDADDEWDPTKLAQQMPSFAETAVGWSYTRARYLDVERGQVMVHRTQLCPSGDVLEALLLNDFVPTASVVVRRSALSLVGPFDEAPRFRGLEDWDLWLRLARLFPVVFVDCPLVTYRIHSNNTSRSGDFEARLSASLEIVRRAVARDPDRLEGLTKIARAMCYRSASRFELAAGRASLARRNLLQAMKLDPVHPADVGLWLAAHLPGSATARLAAFRRRARRGERIARAARPNLVSLFVI